MRTYEERRQLREYILEKVFDESNPIDNYARTQWQLANRLPSVEENKNNCDELYRIAVDCSEPAFDGQPELWERFKKECKEIQERFQRLDATEPIDAVCGVAQVGYYLYEEVRALVSEALGLYVPSEEENW